MKQKLLIIIILLLTALGAAQLYAQEDMELIVRVIIRPEGSTKEPELVHRFETGFSLRDSVDNYGNLYIRFHSFLPSVLTFINEDGSVSICTSDNSAKTTYVYEFNKDLKEINKLSFKNEFNSLGAFTKDNDGNYYIFYASNAAKQTEENMALVKYNPKGEKLNTFKLIANAPNSFGGIRIPFDAGTCRIEISGSMVAVYFSREKFDGHQASYAIILDKDSFNRIDRGIVDNRGYTQSGNNAIHNVSHSFNQFILPVENGFILADHGDAYPRCFTFSRFQKDSVTKKLNAFIFPGQTGANATYAAMGGLAKTQNGFIFLGTYGRVKENCRNIFTISFGDDLAKCSSPKYLTDYKNKEGHAGHPKIVSLEDGRYLVLWEFFSYSTQSANIIAGGLTGYETTYAQIINEKGEALGEIQEYADIRLNMNDTLRYNSHNKTVYWAINDTSKSITIYGLKVE